MARNENYDAPYYANILQPPAGYSLFGLNFFISTLSRKPSVIVLSVTRETKFHTPIQRKEYIYIYILHLKFWAFREEAGRQKLYTINNF